MKLRYILPALVAAVAFAGLLAIDWNKGDLNKANAQSTQTYDFERDRFPLPDLVIRGIRSTYVDSFTVTVYISNLNQQMTEYAIVPMHGTIRGIYSVINGTVPTNKATLAFDYNGTSIATLTVAAASTAGTVDWLTGLSQSVLTGRYLAVGSDGKPDSQDGAGVSAHITVVIDPVEGPVND